MPVIEQEIIRRFPKWFVGRKAKLSKALVRSYGRLCRFEEIERFIAQNSHLKGQLLVGQALDFLDVRYALDHIEKSHIPPSGRCIIVANHPAGVIDALALLHMVGTVRTDVRIMANDVLTSLGILNEMLIPVNVFGAGNPRCSIEAMHSALQQEQCLIVFPAGSVSRLHPSGIKDTPWHGGFLRLATKHNAPIIPVRIHARNSALFYGLSAIYKPLGSLLLPREITARRGTRIGMRIGEPQRIQADENNKPSLSAIRQSLYAIGTRRNSMIKGPQPLIDPVDARTVKQELQQLDHVGDTPDGMHIYAGRVAAVSPLLQELGRLRELSFRKVGEGTGRRLDIDRYDTWYHHIVLWNPEDMEIAGAYRLAIGEAVYAEHGIDGFYSASLFKYSCNTLPKLMQGAELGRSFVTPKYWNSRSLDNLWRGIGTFLACYPSVRYLFGPVSISAEIPIAAGEALVRHYWQFYGCPHDSAIAHRPFSFLTQRNSALPREQAFVELKKLLQDMGVKVPTLYKQYTELCNPGGVKFLAFGIDPDFNNSIDGLIELDISQMKSEKYLRYFGSAAQKLN